MPQPQSGYATGRSPIVDGGMMLMAAAADQ